MKDQYEAKHAPGEKACEYRKTRVGHQEYWKHLRRHSNSFPEKIVAENVLTRIDQYPRMRLRRVRTTLVACWGKNGELRNSAMPSQSFMDRSRRSQPSRSFLGIGS